MTRMSLRNIKGRVRRRIERLPRALVKRGVPPSWVRYSWLLSESLPDYLSRVSKSPEDRARRLEVIHPEGIATNPLPVNVKSRDDLPRDRGWWGYSFWDVPERISGETVLAKLPDCRVLPYVDPTNNQFYVTIVNRSDRALDLREMAFRPGHISLLRNSRPALKVGVATWILERVYHNHSHWLTAHLPKIVLLKSRNALSNVLLPARPTSVMNTSLRMMGIDPTSFPTFTPGQPIDVEELTVFKTDRFRPELLQSVRDAVALPIGRPHRRVFVSRKKAPRRQLVNEDEIWPMLEAEDFERVLLEDLSFEKQVGLMRETAVLFGPHGAGLTNMMFCMPGTHVIEIADLSFPNPNFYAVASAMSHRYWLLPGEAIGDGHPLVRDVRVDPHLIEDTLASLRKRDVGISG